MIFWFGSVVVVTCTHTATQHLISVADRHTHIVTYIHTLLIVDCLRNKAHSLSLPLTPLPHHLQPQKFKVKKKKTQMSKHKFMI